MVDNFLVFFIAVNGHGDILDFSFKTNFVIQKAKIKSLNIVRILIRNLNNFQKYYTLDRIFDRYEVENFT